MISNMNQRPFFFASMCLLGMSAVVNSRMLGQSTTAPRFRWSERLAHELRYQHMIANANELTPKDREELLEFVFNRFKHPVNTHDAEMFEDISDEQLRKLAANTRIEPFNLNGDSKAEIIAQGNGLGPCGATGNCIVLVLKITPEGIETLLDSRAGKSGGGFEKIRVLDTSTNGFRDIVLASHVSASDRTLEVFRFVDGKYKTSACYYATTKPAGDPEGSRQPVISRGCPGEK
jgi:hypothetical protein